MSRRVFECERRRSGAAAALGLVFFVVLGLAPDRLAASDLGVVMDEAKLVRLPDKVATIVIAIR